MRRYGVGSGCVAKGIQSAIYARGKNKNVEIITVDGIKYEYRADNQIFRHEGNKLVRIKKAVWLAAKAVADAE